MIRKPVERNHREHDSLTGFWDGLDYEMAVTMRDISVRLLVVFTFSLVPAAVALWLIVLVFAS